jgi:hypothetical protein
MARSFTINKITLPDLANLPLAGLQEWMRSVKRAFVSDVYTPTLTNTTNLAASTAYECQYTQTQNVVTVTGKVDVDPTGAGQCVLGFSLPIATTFDAVEQCGGTAAAPAVAGFVAAIYADVTNQRATFEWVAVDTANRSLYFTFSYRIL